MLSLPIYLRGSTYYLHTRVNGKQFKKSLGTSDKSLAIILASKILESFSMDKIGKFEIDFERGLLKADGPEDHRMMMEALEMYAKAKARLNTPRNAPESSNDETAMPITSRTGLRALEVLEKFFLLKSHLKEATVLSYKNTLTEFSKFLKNPYINDVNVSDISRFQEFLAKKKNSTRTIDNKISILRTVFNFGISQGYFFKNNPAVNRNLQSKREKLKSGWAIFKEDEIKKLYTSEFFTASKEKDPDYYWTLVLGLATGARISEITGLTKNQFKTSSQGTHYIDIVDSKSQAGIREVPIPSHLISSGLGNFLEGKEGKVFKYNLRLGKGSGNAVGKKFKRNLDEIKIHRDKLVFHSLRKFTNDYFMKSDIGIESRCQFFGHEVENINVQVYTRKLTVDELHAKIKAVQFKVLMLSGILKTEF